MDSVIEKAFNSIKVKNNYKKEYSRIYRRIHKYWARKPWYIIKDYIEEYSEPGDTVLDPFCGSGSTGLESILKNRDFLGIDLNPASVFISKKTLDTNFDIDKFEEDYQIIKSMCKKEIQNLYKADEKCPYCGSDLHFIHIVTGPKYKDNPEGKLYCPNCNKRKAKKTRKLNKNEIKKMEELNSLDIPYWYPEIKFPDKFYKDRFTYKGILKVSDMYTRRNLYAASFLLECIKKINSDYEDFLLLAFSNTILHVSKLKGKNVRPLGVNNYWVPDDYIEENVWYRFKNRIKYLKSSKEILNKRVNKKETIGNFKIWNGSALNIDIDKKADYVFTDPPYGDGIQYSELSYVWNAWLKERYNIEEEVIINPKQNKYQDEYFNLLEEAIKEIRKSLKKDGYFTLCFQNKKFSIWNNLIKICKNEGFSLEDISIYDTFGSSYTQNWAKFSPKADIYVTFKNDELKNYYDIDFPKIESLESVIDKVMNYVINNELDINIYQIYDITISILIRNIYYNEEWDTSFSIKSFSKLVKKWLENKNIKISKIS